MGDIAADADDQSSSEREEDEEENASDSEFSSEEGAEEDKPAPKPTRARASRAPATSKSPSEEPASAPAEKKKRTRVKPASTSTKKKSTSRAISENYVRHDTHRKNGIRSGPKSAKAKRQEKWRQQQGVGRWKTAKEYRADKAMQAEQALYCEMLQPSELKSVLNKTAAGGTKEPGGDDGTDDELAAFQEVERQQFGVTDHKTHSDIEADPLSVEAELKEKKRAAVKRQAEAAQRAQSKLATTRGLSTHTDASLLALLREQFRYESFRPGQLETIKRVLNIPSVDSTAAAASAPNGQNVLSIMPTGGGKSLIYQFLSLLLPGLTIIVSPLLSLMKDQLEHLPSFLRGAIWSSENTPKSVFELMNDLQANQIKILFISPEKLLTSGFQNFILESVLKTKAPTSAAAAHAAGRLSASFPSSSPPPGISLCVVDEAHCVAEWSHNFRNSYSRLDQVLNHVFKVQRILGLTATATLSTTTQVCSNLRIPHENIIKVPLTRENLILSTSLVKHENRFTSLVELLNAAPYKGLKSIIVYVNYKSIAEALSKYLKQHGFPSSDYYHAGLPLFQRHKVQTRFMENKLSIIVATCAFGMGLDKRDIRGVIHFNLPRSFENYIQEIGRAGRDGELSFCHAMWSHCDKEISGSLLYSNGVDQHQLKQLLEKVFDQSTRSALRTRRLLDEDLDDEDRPIVAPRHYVALEVEPLRITMELSEEVVGTILTRLERTTGRQWIRLVSCLHNQASIGFHRTNPKVLAQSSGVIRNLLEQNHWLPRSASHSHSGVTFDHERIHAPSMDAAAASTEMPEYNSAEFQQLKQQKGLLHMDLCEAAVECGMDISEVQREIVRLKAAGEISITWSKMSFVVEVLQWPTDDEAAVRRPDAITLDGIIGDLLAYLQRQESMASEKLSIMAAALKMASLPHMRCAPHDAVDRAQKMRRAQLRHQKRLATRDVAVPEPAVSEEDLILPFFDLHKVMDAYFAAEDPSTFLEQLQAQCTEAEADVPASSGEALKAAAARKSQLQLAKDFEGDALSFLRTHGDQVSSGRDLARICHGQKAPSHLAVGRATWQRDRKQNTAPNDEIDDAQVALAPFASHHLWGRYKAIDFPTVLARCEEWVEQWKASAGARMEQESAAAEQRRAAKRQKLASNPASAASTVKHARPSDVANNSRANPFATGEILIEDSDQEMEE